MNKGELLMMKKRKNVLKEPLQSEQEFAVFLKRVREGGELKRVELVQENDEWKADGLPHS